MKRILVLLTLSVVSAVFYIISFPIFNLWFVMWFALVPLFFAISKSKGKLEAFLLSYFFFFLTMMGLAYWLTYVSILLFLLMLFYEGLFLAFFGLIAKVIFSKRLRPLFEAVSISIAWVAIEFCRAEFLLALGWAIAAYSQASQPLLIQIADLAGYSGLTFVIVMVNILVKQIIDQRVLSSEKIPMKKNLLVSSVIVVSFFLMFTIFYGAIRLNTNFQATNSVRISVIQGNIPQDQKWNPKYRSSILEKYNHLTKLASKDKPDLISWPETAVPGYFGTEPRLEQLLSKLAKEVDAYLLVGMPRRSGLVDDYYNSAVLFNPQGQMITFYDKQRLIPFGEYVPIIKSADRIRTWFRIHENFELADFRAGTKPIIFHLFKGSFGVLICFEDFFSVSEFIKNGADFIINLTNDAWFRKSSEPFQHAQASVFRAVEHRVPVVRCSNTGVSEFIDLYGKSYGKVVDSSGEVLMVSGYKTGHIYFPPRHLRTLSFYTKHEFWFAKLCLVLLVLIISIFFMKRPSISEELK